MRRVFFVVLAVALWAGPSAMACGEKYLLIGRSASYRGRYVAIHPSRILLYGAKAAGNGEIDVRRILQRAGHHVDFAADDAQLQTALSARKYDLVITPVDGLDGMETRVRSLASDALVLPILFASNDAEIQQAEKQYECIARSDARQRSFLGVVDDAMALRLKGLPITCRWTKKS